MVATFGGGLALVVGLGILLLPLLASELSRPRDSAWGALMLLLGLDLLSSSDRLSGAPMLGVLCGGLLIGRLVQEVAQGRWRQLSTEEQTHLGSRERWGASLQQLGVASTAFARGLGQAVGGLSDWLGARKQAKTTSKRWVRPEGPSPTPVVHSLEEVEALINPTGDQPAGDQPGGDQPAEANQGRGRQAG